MNRSFTLLMTLAAALTVGACGDGGTGPDDNGGVNTPARQILANPSYSNVIQDIFNRKGCAASSCHGTATQSAGLNLASGSSYASLVNVASTQVGTLRVIPGNANESYLIVKVEGRQTVGQSMPVGGSVLDNIDLTNLKNWINQGANNN